MNERRDMRILVVEDSRTQAEALRALLEDAGYVVEVASSGEEALARVYDTPFDLVISDIMMGGISGYHVCYAIKTELNKPDLPVMLLTSLTDPMDIVRGLESGADNFFRKPYDPPRLLERIRHLLDSREARRGEDPSKDLKISFLGRTFSITAEKEQILDLLIATFEDSVLQNRQLREREQELQAAKKALARHADRLEERLERIVATVPDVLYSKSPDRKVLHYVSPACAKVIGFTQDELIADPDRWNRAIEPEHREMAEAAIVRLFGHGEPVSIGYSIRTGTGERRWIEDSATPVVDADGNVLRADGIARDVTGRKEAELALGSQKEFLRQVIDADPNLIFVRDSDGSYLLASQAVAEFYGTTVEELVATGPVGPPPGHEGRSLFRYDEEVAASGERKTLAEEALVHPGTGKTSWFQTIKLPLRLPGSEGVKVLGVAMDVTERRQMEEQVRLSQKMEAVGRLAGGVAHDFNNTLTAIRGFADLVRERCVDEEMVEEIDEIRKGADRATALARQLLAFSRRQVIQPRTLDLGELVHGMSRMLTRLIPDNVSLELTLPPTPVWTRADPNQMEQVLLNLVMNARDAMPRGGAIGVEVGRLAEPDPDAGTEGAPTAAEEEHAFIRVTDAGAGIPADVLPHIFDLFYTTKEVGSGTGFGLATVQGIVEELQGSISVDSRPGCTSFTVMLPEVEGQEIPADLVVVEETVDRSASADADGDELAHPGRSARILIAEDDRSIQRVMLRCLDRGGYTAHTAGSGEEVLNQLASGEAVDLLITDLVLPDMIGWDLAKRVAEIRPEIRVLYMSGHARDDVARTVLSSSVAFLQKPFLGSELTARVRAILEGSELAEAWDDV